MIDEPFVIDFSKRQPQKSGIYCIQNIVDGKKYIGSAIRLKSRVSNHFRMLENNTHTNIHLQRAYNQIGKENFSYSVLECVEDKNMLIETEQKHIDFFRNQDENCLYNIRPLAKNNLGFKFSEELKKKMSVSSKGKPKSEHAHKAMSLAMMGNTKWVGKNHKESTKKKMSEWQIGRILPESTKEKLSNNFKNRKLSNEQILDIRESGNGEKQCVLAQKYGVADATIWRIKHNKTWRVCVMTTYDTTQENYNKFTEYPLNAYNILSYLIDNNEQIFKLLKYADADAWKQDDLTKEEKLALIYNGTPNMTKYRIFLDNSIDDSWLVEAPMLRISPMELIPTNHIYGIANFAFEVYCHSKCNHLSNYTVRVDAIIQELIKTLNGANILTVGRLFFDARASPRGKVSIIGALPFKGKVLIMTNHALG